MVQIDTMRIPIHHTGLISFMYVSSELTFKFSILIACQVREARRLVGDFVWTEHEPNASLLDRSVGVGAYTFDCHWVSLYVANDSSNNSYIAAEGCVLIVTKSKLI